MNNFNFHKIFSFFIILIFIATLTLPISNSDEGSLKQIRDKNIIFVGGKGENNFSKIQDAIDSSDNDATIYVYNGTYHEHILIDKKITLIGESKQSTIIDGRYNLENQSILHVTSDHVKVTNFTFQNAKGIDGRAGLFMTKFPQRITRNNIFKNNIVKNCSYGVMFVNPMNTIISNNSLYGCGIGPHLTIPFYFDNVFDDNKVNSKPILMIINEKNKVINNVETDSVILIKCSNIKIKNINITNNTVGIDISYCHKINVSHCKISNMGRGGIYVHHSNFCTFEHNNFTNDNWGIFFRKSHFNKIINNNFWNISMPDWFAQSYFNYWNSNYWEEPVERIKMIYGKIGFFENFPWFNYDLRPKSIPN